MSELWTKDFASMKTPRADLFWTKQATELRETLACQSATFIASATLEQIEAVAGIEFSKQGENTKRAIIEVMRCSIQ
ncbi:MAG: hypothetical protein BWK72_18075 [Rhodoferax ferrireducens]|uniref:Uncharacterized protein n=1 Tax=Rhodoferax ferrireducens TaxID=192843 RepID=A0A1W9KQ38_9BURK|nr:MAG: hypothetical protein BWK72_18075 [Rhodoferax ferrireducens]